MAKLFLYDQIKGDTAEKELFAEKVVKYADMLNTNPDWLMLLMYFESRLNPAAQNSTSKATGLIQFMPPTARYLGTSTDELKQMKGSEQLDYVYQYFKPYKGKLGTLTDVYLTIFYPYAVGKPETYVLGSHLTEEIVMPPSTREAPAGQRRSRSATFWRRPTRPRVFSSAPSGSPRCD